MVQSSGKINETPELFRYQNEVETCNRYLSSANHVCFPNYEIEDAYIIKVAPTLIFQVTTPSFDLTFKLLRLKQSEKVQNLYNLIQIFMDL